MTQFYAQPYDMSATGFYFDDREIYKAKINSIRNSYGDPVEEFEIMVTDGELIDIQVCKALGLYQSNIGAIMEKLEEWSDSEKARIIIAVGECGYDFDIEHDDPETYFDITVYGAESFKDLAYEFVEEGLFGDIPEHLEHYIDYDAIARDLRMDYCETNVDGATIIYRCH